MARDALDPGPLDAEGNPTFPNAPRLPDGSIDWPKIEGRPRVYWQRDVDGEKHLIDARPTVPHPVTGEPIRPE